MNKKETVLVTGCAGLFGAHLSKYLLKNNFDVVGVDNLLGGYRENIPNNVAFYKFDLRDTERVKAIFALHKPKYVYHTAAFAAVGLSPFMRHECYQNNMLSFSNLVNACINEGGFKKFIHFSSMDVYGNNQTPYVETLKPDPEDPYGISKYAMELDLRETYKQFGLRYSIVRPHNVHGIGQQIDDPYRNVLAIWIRKILNNQPITVYGDGTQKRAFSDVCYYMEPLLKLMDKKYDNEIYNIGADQPVQIIDAAKIAKKIADENGYKNVNIIHLEPRNEVHTAYSDHEKAKNDLNFVDNTDLKKLLTGMLLWARKQPARPLKTVKSYEVEKGLYSYWKSSKK